MSLLDWQFQNRFREALPGDPELAPYPRQVLGACWSPVLAEPASAPRLVAWSREAGALLEVGEELVAEPRFAEVLSGNRLLPGMAPYASCYGGHQFGHWAGQLGDGRALNLGEVVGAGGLRWEVQLKGAGRTPYSRSGDGRAVLRSSLREFVCSEAMHHLGVPTTRALSLVLTGDEVMRDMFYDGRPALEPGAVVCRLAPTFLRFGSFELPAHRGEVALLRRLVEFTMAEHFPDCPGIPEWFSEVCERTGRLLAEWMRVGFVHGVMNTDNMSVLGLTLDYGPYGWLEGYDPDWTPNTTDAGRGRYRFGHQPAVAGWNLAQLGRALLALGIEPAPLEEGLDRYERSYQEWSRRFTSQKFGWRSAREADWGLVDRAFALMARAEVDMTLFFRGLGRVSSEAPGLEPLLPAFYDEAALARDRGEWERWLGDHARSLAPEPEAARRSRMDQVNPLYVPRNYLAQEAIDRVEAGDPSRLVEWLDTLRRPYEEQPGREVYAARRPEWARHRPGCSQLSCSS